MVRIAGMETYFFMMAIHYPHDHSNGTVLVCINNVYGTVCDDFWDPLNTTVMCAQLGFSATG